MGLIKLLQAGIKNKEILKGGFNFSKEKTKQFLKILKDAEKTEKAAKRSAKMFTGKTPSSIPGNTRVYHGTRSTIHKDPTRGQQSVLYVSPEVKTAEQFAAIGPGGGLKGLNQQRIFPLKIKTNTIKEKIFDPSNKKHLKKLKENTKFKEFVDDEVVNNQEFFRDQIGKPIKNSVAWLKEFKKNNYFNNIYSDDGINYIAATLETSKPLQNILKKLGFDGFTISEGSVKNIGVFLDKTKGGSKILKSIFEKNQGGSIRDYYKTYNTQRFI